jgi:hypothetical protein
MRDDWVDAHYATLPGRMRRARLLFQSHLVSPDLVSDESTLDDRLIRTFGVALDKTTSVTPLVSNLVSGSVCVLDSQPVYRNLTCKVDCIRGVDRAALGVRFQYDEGNQSQTLHVRVEWLSMGQRVSHAEPGIPGSARQRYY